MREFFKFSIRFLRGLSLRKKSGLFTLILNWVFLFGWIRSHSYYDQVTISTGISSLDSISSNSGFLWWGEQTISEPELGIPNGTSGRFAHSWDQDPRKYENVKWYDPAHIFGVYTYKHGWETTPKFWIVPYLLVTLPLTLLAAYLFVSKPGPSTQKKITSPVPAEGLE